MCPTQNHNKKLCCCVISKGAAPIITKRKNTTTNVSKNAFFIFFIPNITLYIIGKSTRTFQHSLAHTKHANILHPLYISG